MDEVQEWATFSFLENYLRLAAVVVGTNSGRPTGTLLAISRMENSG